MSSEQPRRRRAFARRWHRWLGVIAAIPVLWLCVSGLILNHADHLGLHDQEVKNEWVLRHYRQLPDGEPVGLRIGDRLVWGWGGMVFLDEKLLELPGELKGAVAVRGYLAVATDEAVGVFDGMDEMEIQLDDLSLPEGGVVSVSESDDHLMVLSEGGWVRMSEEFLDYESDHLFQAKVVSLRGLDDAGVEVAEKVVQSRGAMPLSRVILDAHSGRLFGWPGWLMTDLTAVSLIVLTLLGLRLFPKRKG